MPDPAMNCRAIFTSPSGTIPPTCKCARSSTAHYDPHEPNHHLYSWNVQTLGNLVEKMDFKVINGSIGRFGYDRFSSVWADRLHIGEFGFRFLRRLIHLIKPRFEVFLVALKE